jgi:aspartate kinase
MRAVIKLGGSVLTGLDAFPRAAASLADRLAHNPESKLVVVVSAEHGATDNLLALAESIGSTPDARALDLLWATGELRSVALLTLALQARGVDAVGLNVHETGIRYDPKGSRYDLKESYYKVNVLRLSVALAAHRVVVVPGFLARGDGDSIVSLGRGGSDLTAVLLAIALGAAECELIKDVPGYFSADPAFDASAQHISTLTYDAALDRAHGGCGVVQSAAIEAAARAGLTIRVRSLDIESTSTVVSSSGYRNEAGISAPSVSEAPAYALRASARSRRSLGEGGWQAVGVGPHGS